MTCKSVHKSCLGLPSLIMDIHRLFIFVMFWGARDCLLDIVKDLTEEPTYNLFTQAGLFFESEPWNGPVTPGDHYIFVDLTFQGKKTAAK